MKCHHEKRSLNSALSLHHKGQKEQREGVTRPETSGPEAEPGLSGRTSSVKTDEQSHTLESEAVFVFAFLLRAGLGSLFLVFLCILW